MQSLARAVGLLAVAALLFVGAAGFSGHMVNDDQCMVYVEGTNSGSETRWAPPGIECFVQESSGTTDEGRFVYNDRWKRTERTGTWLAFVASLLVGAGVVGLAVRRRSDAPRWLRLTAATTLLFAVAGVGAVLGGWQGTLLLATVCGVPLVFAFDRWFWPGRADDHPLAAGTAGAAVAYTALIVASAGWLAGYGAAAYGVVVLLVAATTALPRGRESGDAHHAIASAEPPE